MNYYTNSINIEKVTSEEDYKFVTDCLRNEDYNRVIGTCEESKKKNYYIFYYKGERLGIFYPNVTDKTGVNIVEPLLYMRKRLSKISSFAILSMVYFIFKELNADKLSIKVYENNLSVLRMMKNLKITFEGKFKYGIIREGKIVSLNYFSILKREFAEMLTKWSEAR